MFGQAPFSVQQEHDHEQARAAGFDHHFVKPVETERLLKTFARHD